MRVAFVIVCLGLAAVAAPARAQESACVTIENDAERLACYDRANGRVPRAAPDLPATAPEPPEGVTADRFRMPRLFTREDQEGLAPPAQREVARVIRLPGGLVSIVMANDEVWNPLHRPDRLPRAGEQITILNVDNGYYILAPASGEPFRVLRQD